MDKSQLRRLLDLAHRIQKDENREKEEALNEAYRRLGESK